MGILGWRVPSGGWFKLRSVCLLIGTGFVVLVAHLSVLEIRWEEFGVLVFLLCRESQGWVYKLLSIVQGYIWGSEETEWALGESFM